MLLRPCCALSCPCRFSILINCAGRFLDEESQLTAEGIEQTMALDYYAHTLLTLRLLDTLSRNGPSRIINVSR
jgi:short-subunit dehydrogenase